MYSLKSGFAQHNFLAGVCLNCSLRENDTVFRTYQFCTDELKQYLLPCEPEKKREIEATYEAGEISTSKLLAIFEKKMILS